MHANKRLVINAGSNLAASAVNAIVGLLLAPFLLRELGRDMYGTWALIAALYPYSTLLTLSLNSAVNRWVPMQLVNGDEEGVNRVLGTTLGVYLVAGAAILGLAGILAWGFPTWFGVPDENAGVSRIAVFVAGVGWSLHVATFLFPAILSGIQRYDFTFAGTAGADVVRLLALWTLLPLGHGIVAVAAVTSASMAIRSAVHGVLSRVGMRFMRLNLSLANRNTLRELLGYSTGSMLFSWGEMIQQRSATILVGTLAGAAKVPEYSIPLLLTGLVVRVVSAMSTPVKPEATRLAAMGDEASVGVLYLSVTRFALLAILPIASFLIAFGDPVLRVWLGDQFVPNTPVILTVLVIGASVRLWHVPGYNVVAGLARHRRFGALRLIEGLGSMAFAIAIHIFFDLGALGVALGYSFSEVFIGLAFVTPYCAFTVGVRFRDEIRRSVLPAIGAVAPFLGTALAIRFWGSPEDAAGLVGAIGLLAVVGVVSIWTIGLQSNERRRVLAALRRRS